jgi:1-acyl-sn-glycerol-3-phosphate acyltransferase
MSEVLRAARNHWGRSDRESLMAAFYRTASDNWFRVTWEGLEHLPRERGALLVANHAGVMPVDGAILTVGVEREIGRQVYSLAHSGFWSVPFTGPVLAESGGVVGHPSNANRLLADEERMVLVFPEGGKGPCKPPSERYRLQRFGRGGFVETALRAGVPIVPIVLAGTEDVTPTIATFELMGQQVPLSWNTLLLGPLGAFVPLPARISVRVLEPIHFDEPAGAPSYPRSLVMDHSESIRARMQHALDAMLSRRQSIWGG